MQEIASMKLIFCVPALGDSYEGPSPTAMKDVPVPFQVAILGLSERNRLPVRGKRLLDIACGKGELVEWARGEGVEAYGIDKRAPSQPYFTSRNITSVGRSQGIDAEDAFFDVIVSFQNICLNHAYSPDRETMHFTDPENIRISNQAQEQAAYMISEIGRTLKRGGSAVIFPYIPLLERYAAHILRMEGLTTDVERIKDKIKTIEYITWEENPTPKQAVKDYYGYRTVLTKN